MTAAEKVEATDRGVFVISVGLNRISIGLKRLKGSICIIDPFGSS